ncbi:hypothetical protein AVEN_200025-1 [Araneus ventricosus]|uniref:Uncharacterized protein n=1 Tax=Araneus ventricosus TaxID=182803 RepID=A0A4Y2TD93_ARAVE|nr:hypothetical protein AVEN_200025-1 [Araneus ventricosus]
MSKALVNNVEMSILRDTGASIDLVSRNHGISEDFTGETIWVKQPLDLNFTCLPLARIELQSSDLGRIVTKAAVIEAVLDNGVYLLGNRTADLIAKQKLTSNVNAVITRSQRARPESTKCAETDPTTHGIVSEPAIVVEPDSIVINLPPAEETAPSLLKVSADEFIVTQRECDSLKPCFENAEKGGKSFVNRDNGLFRKLVDHFCKESYQWSQFTVT